MVKKLQENHEIDLFAIAVHDFYTDQFIWGLNAYKNSVRWDFEKETVFVDIPELAQERILYDSKVLAPAAFHCKDPSPFQAFHYGVHRGLKAIQTKGGSSHWMAMEQTWKHFMRTSDVRMGLAALGAELVYAGRMKAGDVDYTNPRLKNVLESYVSWDAARLYREVSTLRLLTGSLLPTNVRRKALVSLHGSRKGRPGKIHQS
jgi:hypothetical protein